MNTLKLISIITLLTWQFTLAFASQDSTSTCNVLRTAKASVTVYKHYWEFNNNTWVGKSEEIATNRNTPVDVPVIQDSLAACHFSDVLTLDNVLLNGKQQVIKLYAHINVQTKATLTIPNKIFTASYSMANDDGRNSFASAYTPELTTNKMGLNFSNERTISLNPHEESLYIAVWFYDNTETSPVGPNI